MQWNKRRSLLWLFVISLPFCFQVVSLLLMFSFRLRDVFYAEFEFFLFWLRVQINSRYWALPQLYIIAKVKGLSDSCLCKPGCGMKLYTFSFMLNHRLFMVFFSFSKWDCSIFPCVVFSEQLVGKICSRSCFWILLSPKKVVFNLIRENLAEFAINSGPIRCLVSQILNFYAIVVLYHFHL